MVDPWVCIPDLFCWSLLLIVCWSLYVVGDVRRRRERKVPVPGKGKGRCVEVVMKVGVPSVRGG